jgi:CHAT domain-containing protein/Flp pilus assembly protein TadD
MSIIQLSNQNKMMLRLVLVAICFSLTAQSCAVSQKQQLHNEGAEMANQGRFNEAILIFEKLLKMSEEEYGPKDKSVSDYLNILGTLHLKTGQLDKAESFLLRALAIDKERLGLWNDDVETILYNLATVYIEKADFTKAEEAAKQSLAIRQKLHGDDDLGVANTCKMLMMIFRMRDEFTQALPYAERALEIKIKKFGDNHEEAARELMNVGELYTLKGFYFKAEPLFGRSLKIIEERLGADHIDLIKPLKHLGGMYSLRGDYEKAEPLYQRALEIQEKSSDPDGDLDLLTNLARLQERKDDYEKAESLLKRAADKAEKKADSKPSLLADILEELGDLYDEKGDFAAAEQYFRRAIAVNEKALDPAHLSAASSHTTLGHFYVRKGDYDKAEPELIRALEIIENNRGPEYYDVILCSGNLASVYYYKGDYAKAEPLFLRSLGLAEKLRVPDDLMVKALCNLANLYRAKGEIAKAITYQSRGNDVRERDVTKNILFGSERQKLKRLNSTLWRTNLTLNLHAQNAPNDPAATRMALLEILRRKGRALDAATTNLARLRQRATPKSQELLDQLFEARSLLAGVALRGPTGEGLVQYQADMRELEVKGDSLEAELNAISAEFRERSTAVSLHAVQNAIPPGAALVEFAIYQPYDTRDKKSGEPHYLAYLLNNRGNPRWADLGEAKPIEQAITSLRDVLRDKMSGEDGEVKPQARELDEKIMRPLRNLLGAKRQLLISPDGLLNLIPFEALVDEKGQYLIKRYDISYLSSGRDLLRRQTRFDSQQEPLIIANPNFDKRDTASSQSGKGAGPKISNVQFPHLDRLEGSDREAMELKSLLPRARLMRGDDATETEVKQASSPVLLHIATHGFFLDDEAASITDDEIKASRIAIRVKNDSDPEVKYASVYSGLGNPLLRSGIFFAGANTGGLGQDDGILTAMEAAGLNLWGTRMVVLSACDTGIGDIKNGDGVYGLRRALMLAGAETQVISLWPVSDAGTTELMIGYYKALQVGSGRSIGLKKVRLAMLENPVRRHPYYWASFIQSGEWASLGGLR